MKSLLLKFVCFCAVIVLISAVLSSGIGETEYPTDEIRNDFSYEYTSFYDIDKHKTIGNFVEIVNVAGIIQGGGQFVLTIRGEAKTMYDIKVYFKSGRSVASGLESHYSDSFGVVTWEFKVSPSTSKGNFRVVITSHNSYDEFTFTVV